MQLTQYGISGDRGIVRGKRDGMLFINVFERGERERERGLKDWSCHEHIPFPHHTQSTSCQSKSTELLVTHYYESKVHNPTKHVKLFQSLEKTLDTMLTMSHTVHLRTCNNPDDWYANELCKKVWIKKLNICNIFFVKCIWSKYASNIFCHTAIFP